MYHFKPAILFLIASFAEHHVFAQVQHSTERKADSVTLKIDSLQAVTVKAAMRPHIKGDTLEYNTEHLVLRSNAVVEELLQRLPGLRVDMDGNITYNGEKIEHLLVDGEDIFGATPTMVTRNFDANKIARVQILDRKDDLTAFTGIDNGGRTKTLNLVLKESAKDGYFGKVEAGGSGDKQYSTDGTLADFKDNEQLTVLGLASDIGVLGLTSSYGGSPAGLSILNVSPDVLGTSAGKGIPAFKALGLHYANTWSRAEEHLAANFQYSHYISEPVTFSQSWQTLPDTVYGQRQQSYSINRQVQQWVYGIYDWSPSKRTSFQLVFHGSRTQGQNQFGATGISMFNDTLINAITRSVTDEVIRQNVGGSIAWRVQVGRKHLGTFSSNISVTKIDNSTNGYLNSVAHFLPVAGNLSQLDTVDQRKQIATSPLTIGGTLNFTMPFAKGAVFGASYGISATADNPIQATFDRGDGKFQTVVDSLTSGTKTQVIDQHLMVTLNGKLGHFRYSLAGDMIVYDYRQQDLLSYSLIQFHDANLAPRILLNYNPNPTAKVEIGYTASTQNPSVAQLQPVENNIDPLHITMGNPDLKPTFNQLFVLNVHQFKTWQLDLNASLNLANNGISSKTTTDSRGRQILQPVNVRGGIMAEIRFSAHRKVLWFDAGVHTEATFGQTVNYVNDDLSRNDGYSYTAGLNLNRYLAGKLALLLNTSFAYFTQVSSVNPGQALRYWTQNHQCAVTLFFVRHFEFNTSATYSWQQNATGFAGDNQVVILNMYVSRNFVGDRMVVKFQVNNILNENVGISRTNTANVNSQTSTNILGRYWMLSATWHFDRIFKARGSSDISR